MYGYIVYVKTDKRSGINVFDGLQMKRDKPLIISLIEFENGPEHSLMRRMVRNVQG